jgi:hypothetical protein
LVDLGRGFNSRRLHHINIWLTSNPAWPVCRCDANEHRPIDRRDDSKTSGWIECRRTHSTKSSAAHHQPVQVCRPQKVSAKDALDEIAAVEKPEAELTDIEIFSPVELRELLTAARPEIIPWLSVFLMKHKHRSRRRLACKQLCARSKVQMSFNNIFRH